MLRPNSRSYRTASIRSGIAGGLAGELGRLSYRRAAAPRTARLSEVGGRFALVPLRAISMSLRCLRVATRASASMAR
jgi:hypothetical protein